LRTELETPTIETTIQGELSRLPGANDQRRYRDRRPFGSRELEVRTNRERARWEPIELARRVLEREWDRGGERDRLPALGQEHGLPWWARDKLDPV
jgi:hypothetical protein